MSITKFTKNINYHQSQPDKPVLSPQELKVLFDQAGIDIKNYINTILTTEVDSLYSNLNTKITNNVQSINTINNNLRKEDILNVATNLISSRDNLNSYMTCGIYTSNTGEISSTLVNTPITGNAFKLIVEYLHDTSRIRQTIYVNNENSYTYVRTYNGSWGRWIKQPSYNIYEIPITEIAENSNINNLFAPGTYFCPTGAVAQTLTNCPATTGFKLISEQLHNPERYRQTIYTNTPSSDTYVRTYTGSWGSWYKINMTVV